MFKKRNLLINSNKVILILLMKNFPHHHKIWLARAVARYILIMLLMMDKVYHQSVLNKLLNNLKLLKK